MPRIDFNQRVTLQKLVQGYGRGGGEETIAAEKTVWGAVEETSMTFKVSSGQMGLCPELFVHLWRREFADDDYTHCIVDGKPYRIVMTGKSYNDLYVKLLLERG